MFCMRNCVALLLCCLYLTAFTGVTVTVHYCMNSVASVSFDKPYKDKECQSCEKKEKACCDDRQAVLKGSGQHEAAAQKASFDNDFVALINHRHQSIFQLSNSYHFSYKNKSVNPSPPVPLYQVQCVYRI